LDFRKVPNPDIVDPSPSGSRFPRATLPLTARWTVSTANAIAGSWARMRHTQ